MVRGSKGFSGISQMDCGYPWCEHWQIDCRSGM
jgi:hypothetical protein